MPDPGCRIPDGELGSNGLIARRFVMLGLVGVMLFGAGCAHRKATGPVTTAEDVQQRDIVEPPPVKPGRTEKGIASWYGEPYHGRRTASGEIYDMHRLTAAHRTLEFGTVVRVTRRDTQAGVRVRINDRGPFIEGRIIDLSYAAAKKIGLDVDGLAPVKMEVVGHSDTVATARQAPAHEAARGACLWIQVGAFSDLGNARRLEEKLERTGERAVVMDTPGGMYRVRVGPFAKEREAEEALKRVRTSWPEAQLIPCG